MAASDVILSIYHGYKEIQSPHRVRIGYNLDMLQRLKALA